MSRFRDLLLNVMFVFVLIIVARMLGPSLETVFFPVYSKFDPVLIESTEEGVVAQFRYEKLRACPAQGFAWYTGDFGNGGERVSVEPVAQLTPRTVGEHLTTPYLIRATSEQLRDDIRAEIFNRCHPFWLTRTEIYP